MTDKKVKASIELDVSGVEQGAQRAGEAVDKIKEDLDGLGNTSQQSLDNTKKNIENLTKGFEAMQKVGRTLTATITLPLTGLGLASTKAATEFEFAMAEVSAISGATGDDLGKLEEQARELGKTTFFSAQEAAEGMKYYAMAGYEVDEIMSVMPGTLDLAVASNTDLAKTCDIVSDAMTALKMEVEETTRFTDILAMASSKSNTNVEMMGESFKYCAPVAGELGIKAEDLAVGLGLMANAGIKSTMSGTQMRTALARLVKPTKEMQSVMDKYNISIQTNSDGTVDLMGTMVHLREVLGENNKELTKTQKANIIATLMGQEAMAGWSAIIGATDDDFNSLTESIYNSEGATKAMSETMGNTFQGKLKTLSSAFGELKIVVGNILIPIFEKLVDTLTNTINWFNDLDEDTQKLIVTVGGIAAAIGPAMVAIGGLGKTILGANKTFGSMLKLFGSTGSSVGLFTAGMYVAIGALVALMAYVGSSNSMLTSLQREFGAVGEVIGTACEMINGAIQLTFGNALIWIGGVCKALIALAKGDFKEAGSIMKDTMTEASANTAKAMTDFGGYTSFAISKIREMDSITLKNFEDNYVSTMETLETVTEDNLSEAAKIFGEKFQGIDNQTITTFKGTSDTMALLLNGITENMDKSEMEKVFEKNMEKMMRAGELTTDALEKDFANTTKTIADNMSTGSAEIEHAATTVFENFKNASTRGMSETVDLVVSDVQKMNADTFNELTNMGGSWGQIFAGITDNTSMSSEEMKTALLNNISQMGMTGSELMNALQTDMNNHLQGISTTANSEFSKLPVEVQESINGMIASGAGASEVKNAIVNGISGTGADASAILNELGIAVDNKTSEAASKAESGGQKVESGLTKGLSKVGASVGNAFKGATTSIEKETSNISKTADTNFSKVSKTAEKNTKDMANKVKTNATNMYNGAKTSFSSMATSATNSTNTMKNNVINNVAIMKNSAIKFWGQIRDEYSKSITGEIKITRTITEKVNKVVNVTTEEDKGGKAFFIEDSINLTEKNSALKSLAVIKSADKIETNDNKKTQDVAPVTKETKNITYNYSYTSPKESSISELRRKDRIQAQRIALSR